MSTTSETAAPTPPSSELRLSPAEVMDQLQKRCRSAGSLPGIFSQAMAVLAQRFKPPYALFQMQSISRRLEEEYHDSSIPKETWRHLALGPLLGCVMENDSAASLFREPRNNIQLAAICVPVRDTSGEAVGGIAILVQCEHAAEGEACLAELQAYVLTLQLLISNRPQEKKASRPEGNQTISTMIAAEHESLHSLAFGITNGFKRRFGCEEVCLGRVNGQHVKLLSVSGMDQLYPNSPGSTQIRQAMEECLDVNGIVCDQDEQIWSEGVCNAAFALHHWWRTQTGDSCCLSLPLRYQNQVVAILSLRRQKGNPFTENDVQMLRDSTGPLGAALLLNEKANLGLLQHGWKRLQSLIHCDSKSAAIRQRVVAAALTIAALVIVFGQATFHVSVPCRLASTDTAVFGAPFEGEIAASFVEEGQQVEAGQLLFAMDTSGLELQRDRLLAEQAQAELELAEALKERDRARAAQADSDLNSILAELQIVGMQLDQATVKARWAGRVMEGNPRDRVGEVVPMGDTVLKVAALEGLNAELLIPEDEVVHMKEGNTGRLVTNARPHEALEFVMERIHPAAQVVDGDNVYVAQVSLKSIEEWQRIGMEGVAHVNTGQQPIWWILLHKPIRWSQKMVWW